VMSAILILGAAAVPGLRVKSRADRANEFS